MPMRMGRAGRRLPFFTRDCRQIAQYILHIEHGHQDGQYGRQWGGRASSSVFTLRPEYRIHRRRRGVIPTDGKGNSRRSPVISPRRTRACAWRVEKTTNGRQSFPVISPRPGKFFNFRCVLRPSGPRQGACRLPRYVSSAFVRFRAIVRRRRYAWLQRIWHDP